MGERRMYGPAFTKDGVIQYFSPSSLTLGDPDSPYGCLRKWWYEKVKKLKSPQTKAQAEGEELHQQNEDYLTTGINALGSLALRGKHMLPPPGVDLLVEIGTVIPVETELKARDLERQGDVDGAEKLRAACKLGDAPLKILGIPVNGYIDLMHGRCKNYGASDITDIDDPPGTVEVIDWKTTGKIENIKPPLVMASTIQMTTYGKYAMECIPDLKHVRLSHGYYITKGSHTPRKVTLRVLPEKIDKQWDRVKKVACSLIDVAKETIAERVDANTRSCGGCFHRSYCKAGNQEDLSKVFGSAGAERIARRLQQVTHGNVTGTSAPASVGKKPLLNLGKAKAEADPEAVRQTVIKLAREEAEAKYPGLSAAYDELLSFGLGLPQFSGELAQIVSEFGGNTDKLSKGVGLAGSGDLAEYGPFSDPPELFAILGEVKVSVGGQTNANTDTDSMASDSSVVDTTTADAPSAVNPDQEVGLLPPDAPATTIANVASDNMPVSASDSPSPSPSPVPAPESPVVSMTADGAPTKRGRGRPRKIPEVAATPVPASVPAQPAGSMPTSVEETRSVLATVTANTVSVPATADVPGHHLYVGCTPRGRVTNTLWPLISEITQELNRRAGEAGDFRYVKPDHDLAYGRWKGLVANMIRVVDLEPGHYVIDGPLTDVAFTVAETLSEVFAAKGGLAVWGVR